MRLNTWSTVLLIVLGLGAACAPVSPTGSGAGGVGASASASAPAPLSSGPKVLTLVGREGVIGNFPGVTGGGGGRNLFVHDYLTATDPNEEEVARLAQEMISVEDGTWRINPDGTMDTIWKLRPNVKWHDDAPFTADDLMFSFTAFKDPALPSLYGEALKLMTGAEVIDDLTFVVHWSQVYAGANKAPGLDPMPRHLLEELYLSDRAAFPDSSFFGGTSSGPARTGSGTGRRAPTSSTSASTATTRAGPGSTRWSCGSCRTRTRSSPTCWPAPSTWSTTRTPWTWRRGSKRSGAGRARGTR